MIEIETSGKNPVYHLSFDDRMEPLCKVEKTKGTIWRKRKKATRLCQNCERKWPR